jgi:nitrite reductase/ring-hydroxylating ferredoxin subunit
MWKRLLGLFGKAPAVVKGTAKLADGHAKSVTIGDPLAGNGYELLFCRVEGELHVLDAVCPHQGGRLAEGPLKEGRIATCPLHMYDFDARTGESIGALCKAARTFKVRETADGDAEIRL